MVKLDPARSRVVPFLKPAEIRWQDRPFTTLQAAAAITGLSPASLYKFAADGKLTFRKLGGRTLVETGSLVALLETAETWRPSACTSKATGARVERARASWVG